MKNLTAGEECAVAAKTFNYFSDRAIPPILLASALGVAIIKGTDGTAVVRLASGDFSAPCAFALYNASADIDPYQETVILFMSERSVIGLIKNDKVILNQTYSFLPGPMATSNFDLSPTDMYVYVRYNGQFTPPELITAGMTGWQIGEDTARHTRWHGGTGGEVTWFDVLTNKITVDRSSVGNALYLVLNLLAGKNKTHISHKNFVDPDKMVGPRPSDVSDSAGTRGPPPQALHQQQIPHQVNNSQQQLSQKPINLPYNQLQYQTNQLYSQQQQQVPQGMHQNSGSTNMSQAERLYKMNTQGQQQYQLQQQQLHYSGNQNPAGSSHLNQSGASFQQNARHTGNSGSPQMGVQQLQHNQQLGISGGSTSFQQNTQHTGNSGSPQMGVQQLQHNQQLGMSGGSAQIGVQQLHNNQQIGLSGGSPQQMGMSGGSSYMGAQHHNQQMGVQSMGNNIQQNINPNGPNMGVQGNQQIGMMQQQGNHQFSHVPNPYVPQQQQQQQQGNHQFSHVPNPYVPQQQQQQQQQNQGPYQPNYSSPYGYQ